MNGMPILASVNGVGSFTGLPVGLNFKRPLIGAYILRIDSHLPKASQHSNWCGCDGEQLHRFPGSVRRSTTMWKPMEDRLQIDGRYKL